MIVEAMNCFGVKLGNQERYYQALMVFKLVLENGDKRALNDIAYTYELMGEYDKAREHYMAGITAGVKGASYNLARFYGYGIDCPIDYSKAFEYYTISFKQGYSEAARKLAHFYRNGLGVLKNERMAFKYFKKGVVLDKKHHTISPCIAGLACCYEFGVGCKQSDRKTFKTNVKAIKQARTGINLYNLAQCYIFGKGTKVNIRKALEYLYEAANKNYPDAYYQLAALYNEDSYSYKGKRYSLKNDNYSLFLLTEAYRLGSPKADLAVAEMSLSGDNPNNMVDINRAIEAIVAFQSDKYRGNSCDMDNYRELKHKYPNDIDWDDIEQNPETYIRPNNESIAC